MNGSGAGLPSVTGGGATPVGPATRGAVERVRVALVRRCGQAAAADHIADLAVALWQGVDSALSPVIGQRGVAALYQRSLYLTRAAHPLLAEVHDGPLRLGDLTSLREVLAHHAGTDAAAACAALLQTFCDLLAHLIGAALGERLLQPVWNSFFSGPAAQDSTI